METYTEARIGSLIAGGGMIWAAYVSTAGFSNLQTLFPLPSGPLEVCGLGVLIWLHAKWRRSIRQR